MIGKQTKGTSFGGCVRYVLKEEKSKLLEAVGVGGTPEQMAKQFELQALLNDKVKNIVGHTSLNFSPEDSARLRSDDALMLSIAHDYMKLMGIENTQYIIARHIDREHLLGECIIKGSQLKKATGQSLGGIQGIQILG